MSIRRATRADLERLVDLNIEVHDFHVAHLPEFFKPARREDLAAYFEEMLANEAARIFVACERADVAGYILLVIRERLETPVTLPQRWLYIEQIGVGEGYRRRGHATDLIEAARATAKRHGLNRIELDTYGFNERAQQFFRRVGFETRSVKMAIEIGSRGAR